MSNHPFIKTFIRSKNVHNIENYQNQENKFHFHLSSAFENEKFIKLKFVFVNSF
jgi:hypothetical protein